LENYTPDIEIYNIPEPNVAQPKSVNDLVVVLYVQDLEENRTLLEKILTAIKLDIDKDVTIIPIKENESINISKVINGATKKVLSFGLGPKKLGLNASFAANYLYPTESFFVMLTYGLGKLELDKEKKKALWMALQGAFVSK